MYELFNPSTTYTLPDGTKADGASLESAFPLCTSVPYAAVAEDGILSELSRLSVLKDAYGIDEADPATAIDAINAEVRRRRNQREFDQQAIETTQQAVGELGVMAATSMQSTAELGATVAALQERIVALEGRK